MPDPGHPAAQLERQLQAEMTEEVSEGLRRELEALREADHG